MEEQVYVDELFGMMMFQVCYEGTKVVQYPYRTATLSNVIMELPRYDDFEGVLAEKANARIDNHTVYKVTLKDGSEYAIMCHDSVMYLGLGITEERW